MAWRVEVSRSEVVDTLRLALGPEFIAALSEDELSAFVELTRKHRYRKGEAIFHEDDLPGDVYIVVEGWVKHHQTSPTGEEFTHFLSPPGDFFGRFGGARRAGGTVALTDCSLLVVNRSAFLELIALVRSPHVYLIERQAQRGAILLGKIHDLAFLNVPMRLAKVLLEVSEKTVVNGEARLVIPDYLNQTEIAHLVGASRESVNQWLKHFANQHAIKMQGRRITIEDEGWLRHGGSQ